MGLTHRQVYCVIREELRKGPGSQLWKLAEQLRREGMGWSYDGLGSWTNEAIFNQLSKLGVDTSPEQFRAQAVKAGRCFALEDGWRKGIQLEDSPWEDYPFMAAEELWRRLVPDLLCPEVVASRLEAVLDQVNAEDGRPAVDMEGADIAAVLHAMDYLESFPVEQRMAKFEELLDCTTYDFDEWFLDFILDYGTEHLDEVTRVATVMSGFSQPGNYLGDLAISLARAGRREDAARRVAENLKRFPQDVWIRIKAGDVQAELNDHENALETWITALRMAATPYDWDGAAERIQPLLERLDRREAWRIIKRQHPRPRPSPGNIGVLTSDPSPRLVPLQPAPLFTREKTGRNDPCPCGSGKKYKKCCMNRD